MKEWSDDELDELFRKSAEEFEPTYEANNWQDLRRRLDEVDGITGGGWLKSAAPWLAGVLLLLLGGIGSYYYGNKHSDAGHRAEKIVVSARGKSGGEPAARPEGPSAATFDKGGVGVETGDPDKSEEPSQQKIVSRGNESREFAAAPTAAQKIKELPRNPASVSGVRKPTDPDGKRGEGAILLSKKSATLNIAENSGEGLVKKSASPVEESTVSQVGNESTGIQPQSGQYDSADDSVGSILEKPESSSLRDEWPALKELALRGMFQEGIRPSYPAIASVKGETTDTAAPGRAAAEVPLWSVRIGISPDLSTVKISEMMNTMRPGPSASLLVDYNLNDKWALQTGVIRSLKTYNAEFADYNGPEEWGNDPMPASIDGDCRVFELPVNLRYDFGYDLSPRQKARWFIGAGVSSYKMQRETYTYHYDTYSAGQQRPPKEMGKGTGWYLLSHANVSVGYEHRLTQRLSVIAEPYLRVPLRGVGYGKVDLFSAGVWFSARYTPVFRK